MTAARIVLATLNARWSHCAFGLRYLLANMGPLQAQTVIREFTISDPPARIVERLLAESPAIVGFGIYIWNRRETTQVIQIMKQVAPHIQIVIGGPEPTHAADEDVLLVLADVTIRGEADTAFREVCTSLLAGAPTAKIIATPKPDPANLVLPYDLYTDDDLKHRLIYVEASRGCPFTCEFCLSSIEDGVRAVPLEPFLAAMGRLLERGCRTFKFVDRTFNLKPSTATAILTFFQARWRDDLFLHFEMVPDRLPESVQALLAWFPKDSVQLEIGIQSFTPIVGELISRRMDTQKTETNLKWLRENTGIHVHADLIVGLPGETPDSFRSSFDALWRMQPGEIQVGILKLLPGTPLIRHVVPFAMQFNRETPYDLLASRDFPFVQMQRFKRFARYFEIYVNDGGFVRGLDLALAHAPSDSPFEGFLAFTDWLWATTGAEHGIARARQYQLLADYLDHLGVAQECVDEALATDAVTTGCTSIPSRLHAAAERARRLANASSVR